MSENIRVFSDPVADVRRGDTVSRFEGALGSASLCRWIQLFYRFGGEKAKDRVTVGTFTAGDFPLSLAFDGANIWVANQNSGNVAKL